MRYNLASEEELEVFSSLPKGQGIGVLMKPLSERNELDVVSFIASTIAVASPEALEGADHSKDDNKDDTLIAKYLLERSKPFDLALQRITEKYPDLEYY